MTRWETRRAKYGEKGHSAVYRTKKDAVAELEAERDRLLVKIADLEAERSQMLRALLAAIENQSKGAPR